LKKAPSGAREGIYLPQRRHLDPLWLPLEGEEGSSPPLLGEGWPLGWGGVRDKDTDPSPCPSGLTPYPPLPLARGEDPLWLPL